MESYTPEQREALNTLLHDYIKTTQPGLLPLVHGLIAVDTAVRDISLFNVALCESEGRGFSCSEIEEYADLMCAIDRHELATEIIGSHALEDTEEDEDMPEHLAAAIEYQKRWSE